MNTGLELAQELHQAYLDIFSSPSGQVVLKDMARAHYFERSTFSTDVVKMAEAEGERNVILRIRSILNAKPEQTTLVPHGG